MTKELFVNGTLMRGLALNKNLDGSEFLGEFTTEPCYRIYTIKDVHPGMFEVAEGGVAVTGEMYRMSDEIWQRRSYMATSAHETLIDSNIGLHLYCI